MIKQGHVGTLELFTTVSIYQSFALLYHLPNALGRDAYTGAWLLNLLAGLLSVLVSLSVCLLLHRFPGKSIIEIAEELLGRWGGLLLSLAVAGFYLYIAAISTRAAGDSTVSTIMLDTPLSVLMAGGLVAIAAVSYLGLESLTRTALIFSPFILLGFGLVICLSLPDAHWDAIYPLLGTPLPSLLQSSGKFAFTVHDCFFMAILAPYLRQPKSVFRVTFWSIMLVTVLGTVLILVVEAVLSYPSFKLVGFPVYEVVRLIYIGRFLQRIEALFVVMVVVVSLVYSSMAFHTGILALAQGWKLSDWRPLVFPWAVIVFSLGILPRDSVVVGRWYYSLGNALLFSVLFVLLPMFLYTIAVLKGKKGGRQVEEQSG